MIKKIIFIIGFSIILSFISCTHPNNTNLDNTDEVLENENFLGGTDEINSLFSLENNITNLYVNDEKYWSSQGYTLWKLLEEVPCLSEQSFSVNLNKISGEDDAGYGIVFGFQEINGYINMLIFLINTKGQFTCGELSNSTYRSYMNWTTNSSISVGHNVLNTLKVEYENIHRYALYINNTLVKYIYTPGYSGHSYGKNGYIAVISPKDRLPDETIKIQYELSK